MSDFEIRPNPDKVCYEPKPKPPDPWVRIAQEILDGKWNKCDDSTACSLIIGLKSNDHPACIRALSAICKLHKKRNPREALPPKRRTA